MPRAARKASKAARAVAILALTAVLALFAAPAAAQEGPAISVRYLSADTVYLDAGRAAGLAEGERLEVVRDGAVIAVLEVVFLAEHSASARRIESADGERDGEVRAGDRVRRLPGAPPPPALETADEPAPPPPSTTGRRRPAPPPPARRPATRLLGTVTADWEGFADGGDAGRDWQRTRLGVRLHGRDLGGLPLDLRVRLRTEEVDRDRPFLSGLVPESDSRDRLYELNLSWDPPEGLWAVRAGRLGTSPYAGIGYLDGALGEVRLDGVAVGAFAGRRPTIDELGLDGDGSKVGAYFRLFPGGGFDGPRRWQLAVGGLREETDAGPFRDLVTVETSWTGERWTLAEYARWQVGGELAGPGGGLVEEDGGLVDLALLARLRLDGGGGVTLSYDRLEPRPELDEPPIGPEALFVERLRQGLRLAWDGGGAGAEDWRWSAAVGLRRGEGAGLGTVPGESEDTLSLRLAARHPRLVGGLSFGASAIGFAAPDVDGVLVSLDTGHRFAGGHELALAVGATGHRGGLLEDERVGGWVRLTGWAELPASLFLRGEAELAGGDDYEGVRLGLGIGYRLSGLGLGLSGGLGSGGRAGGR